MSPRTNRYSWSSSSHINFDKSTNEKQKESKKSIWKLYQYIYQSKELEQLMKVYNMCIHLKRHVLIIAILIVRNFRTAKKNLYFN